MPPRPFLALALGVLLLAACGPTPDTLPRRAIDDADQRWAEGAALVAADLGDEWTGTPPEERAGKRATACRKIDYSDLTLTGEANGDSLSNGDRLVALSAVQVYETEAEARAAVERGSSEDSVHCTELAFRDTVSKIDEGFDIADLALREASAPRVGATSRRFQIVLDFEVHGRRVPGFFDIYVVQRDRGVVALFLGGVERFPREVATRALERVDERLRAAPPPDPAG